MRKANHQAHDRDDRWVVQLHNPALRGTGKQGVSRESWKPNTGQHAGSTRVIVQPAMAQSSGSPDVPIRSLPSWTAPDHSEFLEEALKALDTYKKKDPSKGKSFTAECLLGIESCLHK